MATINDVMRELVDSIDGGLACSVVDLESGLMLGAHHTVPYFTQSYIDAVAAAAAALGLAGDSSAADTEATPTHTMAARAVGRRKANSE